MLHVPFPAEESCIVLWTKYKHFYTLSTHLRRLSVDVVEIKPCDLPYLGLRSALWVQHVSSGSCTISISYFRRQCTEHPRAHTHVHARTYAAKSKYPKRHTRRQKYTYKAHIRARMTWTHTSK